MGKRMLSSRLFVEMCNTPIEEIMSVATAPRVPMSTKTIIAVIMNETIPVLIFLSKKLYIPRMPERHIAGVIIIRRFMIVALTLCEKGRNIPIITAKKSIS